MKTFRGKQGTEQLQKQKSKREFEEPMNPRKKNIYVEK